MEELRDVAGLGALGVPEAKAVERRRNMPAPAEAMLALRGAARGFMSAEEAVEYGMIDRVLTNRA